MVVSTHPNFILRSSCIRVNLLSYNSKLTEIREEYDWIAKKNCAKVGMLSYDNKAADKREQHDLIAKKLDGILVCLDARSYIIAACCVQS